jgi:hypothetical protein
VEHCGIGKKYGGMWAKEGPLFESQANLSFGIVLLIAHYKKWSIDLKAGVVLAYGIYLSGSMFTHIYEIIKDKHAYN